MNFKGDGSFPYISPEKYEEFSIEGDDKFALGDIFTRILSTISDQLQSAVEGDSIASNLGSGPDSVTRTEEADQADYSLKSPPQTEDVSGSPRENTAVRLTLTWPECDALLGFSKASRTRKSLARTDKTPNVFLYVDKTWSAFRGYLSSLVGKLKELIGSLPDDNHGRMAAIISVNAAFRKEIAEAVAPALNAEVRAMPHADLDGKKAVCDFVNGELERLGLAVKCPKTGLPAKLKGNPGNRPEIGRFAFEVYIDGNRERSAYSDKLPELQLIDANPANELESRWQAKVGSKDSRPGRKLAD